MGLFVGESVHFLRKKSNNWSLIENKFIGLCVYVNILRVEFIEGFLFHRCKSYCGTNEKKKSKNCEELYGWKE